MGKLHDKIGERGNHVRQAQQSHMILCGWRPVLHGTVQHDEHGHWCKSFNGELSWMLLPVKDTRYEWDDMHTPLVRYFFIRLTGKGWL